MYIQSLHKTVLYKVTQYFEQLKVIQRDEATYQK